MELSSELLVFQFYTFAFSALLAQLFVEFLQLIFVMALRGLVVLILVKDPAGGQSFQIGAAIPVRAAEVVGQVLELWHDQSGGGSWRIRQLASESR